MYRGVPGSSYSPQRARPSSGGYAARASRLPHLRVDATLFLLVLFFTMGMYFPGLVGFSSPTVDSSGAAFFKGSGAGAVVDLPALQAQVEGLARRMSAAEAEAAQVLEENQKLRLDNKVEQSNLKTLTKSKNDEIRGLQARIEEAEKKAKGGGSGQDLQQARERIKTLEQQVAQLKAQPQQPEKKDDPAAAPVEQKHQQKEAAAAVVKFQPNKNTDGHTKPLFTRKTVSVPEPQPLNTYWQQRIHDLFDLAKKDPAALLRKLDDADPLGVNVEGVQDFACPAPEERLTQPDLRRMEMSAQFRGGQGFVFFQHLRKAGGTAFCDLAGRNMQKHTPAYYCMPDARGTLATPPWNASWLLDEMEKHSYRIAANEWDAFPRSKFALADAVFATTLRDPTDRWYSQYRFEHVEHRDGTEAGDPITPFKEWYGTQKHGNMGDNYYVKTFLGGENPPDAEVLKRKGPKGVPIVHGDFYWTYNKYRGRDLDWADFSTAVDTLRRFHAVLVLEWLGESDKMMEEVFGWTEAARRVLPHEVQAKRKEKVSSGAREKLDAAVFEATRKENVFDHLFYHVGRRIFLERYACGGV